MVLEMKQLARTFTFAGITIALLTNTAFSQFFGMGKNRSFHNQVVERSPQSPLTPSCNNGNCTPRVIGWGYHYERWSRWPGSPEFRRAPLSAPDSTSVVPKVEIPNDLDESTVIRRKRGAEDQEFQDAAPTEEASQPPLFEEPPVSQPEMETELPSDVVPDAEEESGTTALPDSFFDEDPNTQAETPDLESQEPTTDDLFDDFESDSGSPLDDLFDDSSMFDLDQFERREPRRLNQRRIARNFARQERATLIDIPLATRSSSKEQMNLSNRERLPLEKLKPAAPADVIGRDEKPAANAVLNQLTKTSGTGLGNPLRHIGAGMKTSKVESASFVEPTDQPAVASSPKRSNSPSAATLQLKDAPSPRRFNPLRGK